MKKLKFFSFLVSSALISSVILFSCKSDSSTGPSSGNPPVSGDSLIFQKDSIVFRSNINQSFHNVYLLFPQDSLKFEFTGFTDFDSSKAYFSIGIYIWNDSTFNISAPLVYGSWSFIDFKKFHLFYTPGYNANPLIIHILVNIFNSISSESKSVILNFFKVFKVKY